MIANDRLGDREEGRAMVGAELRQDTEIAAQLTIDHHAAGQAQRRQYVAQNVH
jgi:hypothetical protein